MSKDYKIILAATVGSRAYGTSTENSDWDFKGVLLAPHDIYLGFSQGMEQLEFKPGMPVPDFARSGSEGTIYELRKFMRLAADANPSILDVLFSPEDCILSKTPEGDMLLSHRNAFLSRKVKHTFSGYAMSQLHRIKRHKGWIMNPPSKAPERSDFGLPEIGMSNSDFGAMESMSDKGELTGVDKDVLSLFFAERDYRAEKRKWDQYNSWRDNRNTSRHALEEAFGYDTKHASHLVRLMNMGLEILETGTVNVRRPDAELLLNIRNGAWSYDQLLAFAEEAERKMDAAYNSSPLPHAPNRPALDSICSGILREWLL